MTSSNPSNLALVELCVNFLFCGDVADGTRAKSHCGSSVTFHVLVDGKGSLNTQLDCTGIMGHQLL
jgi:hypothetical protein